MTFRAVRGSRPVPARRGLTVGAVAAVGLLAAGCSAVTPAQEGSGASGGRQQRRGGRRRLRLPREGDQVKDGGTLTMGLSAEPDMLDPTLSRSLYSRYVFKAMCEKLYDVDQQAHVVPQLATALPTTATAEDRHDPDPHRPRFSDGTQIDSAAVKTTLERDLTNPQSGRTSELGPITTSTPPTPATVVVTFKEPFAPFTAALADRAGMIMSPTALEEYGDDFANHPGCVGPFKFAKRVPQNSIDVVKDPNYYDADKVHLDKIVWRILTDAGIRAANLRSGDVQVADTSRRRTSGELKKDSSLSVLQSQSLGYQGVTFNVGNVDGVGTPAKPINRPDAKDARVRQAFEYAIDRKGLVKAVFNDLYDVACSPISPPSRVRRRAVQECRRTTRRRPSSCSRRPVSRCRTRSRCWCPTTRTPCGSPRRCSRWSRTAGST